MTKITIDRAIVEQALEVLESLQGGCTDSDDGTVEAVTVWCPEVISALRSALAEPVACFIGVSGSAFDLPTTKRAYSYAEQPGDAVAYRLGVACIAAAVWSAGDNIDFGLNLLKELQKQGFGVFDIGAEYAATPKAQPVQDWDEIEALRESLREHMTEIHRLRAALADHSGDATEMVTTKPDNLLRKGLAQALRGMANGFDERRPWYRPWSRPDPLIMRTLRRAADELDKENV